MVNSVEPKAGTSPLLRVTGLKRYFDVSKPLLNRLLEGKPRMILKAVSGIDFEIKKGKTFALVGESGCGKSTVANLVVGLHQPSAGKIEFEG
ncbi:MAG: ATP-binding cassette domain-containing protein, partial [Deltaproteobacteria bacterium]|nr:ATP-binding cassette domain-containing protein [Deltaproteobacteria bacterium]